MASYSKTHPIMAWGERRSVTEWAADARCSVGYVTILQRIERGFTPEDAITTPSLKRHELTVFGETKSIGEWAKDVRCVISGKQLWNRIVLGWYPEEAITQPLRSHATHKLSSPPDTGKFDGQRFTLHLSQELTQRLLDRARGRADRERQLTEGTRTQQGGHVSDIIREAIAHYLDGCDREAVTPPMATTKAAAITSRPRPKRTTPKRATPKRTTSKRTTAKTRPTGSP